MDIPLRNKKGEITEYTNVSIEDYTLLNKYRWYNDKGYVKSSIKNKKWSLHRYIMIEILGNDLTPHEKVDHIDHNPLNNTRENLRHATNSENSRNKEKKTGTSSKFIGISFNKKYRKFQASIAINYKYISASYNKEIHAAHQYNLWINEYNLTTAPKNNIDIPIDFIQWKARDKRSLPTGIYEYKNKNNKIFVAQIKINSKTINLGKFNNLNEAIDIRKKAEIKRNNDIENKRLELPIQYNENGLCYFMIKEQQIILDENLFHELIKYPWYIKGNYVQGPGKITSLSRFITNCPKDMVVDHINNNTFDNRKCNLRIITTQQNMMNKSSGKNSSSKYVGVSFNKRVKSKQWSSRITINGKGIFLGNFLTEIDAAKARDSYIKENNNQFSKLNF
jgi:hypothetical protein